MRNLPALHIYLRMAVDDDEQVRAQVAKIEEMELSAVFLLGSAVHANSILEEVRFTCIKKLVDDFQCLYGSGISCARLLLRTTSRRNAAGSFLRRTRAMTSCALAVVTSQF